MTTKRKCQVLDIIGAVISFAAPAVAALIEFPYTVKAQGGGKTFTDVLHISTAAFSIVAIVAVLTLWRFFRNRLKVPQSGLAVSVVLWAICYGVEQYIHSVTVVLQWAVIGCAVAWVLYFAADQIRKKAGIS